MSNICLRPTPSHRHCQQRPAISNASVRNQSLAERVAQRSCHLLCLGRIRLHASLANRSRSDLRPSLLHGAAMSPSSGCRVHRHPAPFDFVAQASIKSSSHDWLTYARLQHTQPRIPSRFLRRNSGPRRRPQRAAVLAVLEKGQATASDRQQKR